MKNFTTILGWIAILVGVIGLGFQVTGVGYAAIVLGIIALFFRDIRGMGVTSICFGALTFLMTTLF